MTSSARAAFFATAIALLGLSSSPSLADEPAAPADEPAAPAPSAADPLVPPAAAGARVELAAGAQYMSAPIAGGISPFGLGGGGALRLIASHFVLGARGAAFVGESDSSGMSERAALVGGEIGYELRVSRTITLRPVLGAGWALITETLTSDSVTTTTAPSRSRRASTTSAVDVVTQATSIASGSGGGTSGNTSSTTVGALYVAPALETLVWLTDTSFFGFGGRLLYLPSVPYGTDGSAKWLSYGLDLSLGLRL